MLSRRLCECPPVSLKTQLDQYVKVIEELNRELARQKQEALLVLDERNQQVLGLELANAQLQSQLKHRESEVVERERRTEGGGGEAAEALAALVARLKEDLQAEREQQAHLRAQVNEAE